MKAPLTHNTTYQATAKLGSMMALMANSSLIKAQLTQFGFANVEVTGSGANWQATGIWAKPSQEVELPKEIVEFKEV